MQSPPSAFAASMGPYRITSNSKERGDTWRRLLKRRQARKDKEEAEVLDLICYAQHLLKRKKEIEMAMKKLQQMSALRNLRPTRLHEEKRSRDGKKHMYSRKRNPNMRLLQRP